MGSVIVGVIGTLLGVFVGGALQLQQAARARRWRHEDSLRDTKRVAYTEYLRSISASYAQAIAGQRDRSEDARLRAATAEITILAGSEVFGPVRDLTEAILGVHSRIAENAGVTEGEVAEVDRRRRLLIELFKSDLGIETRA
ncbi:hypothetical protein [Streptomyces hokutonensis]|uniref:hypothetical protein n=1 Tax=Streptomyces hokutonensis TaxID=1306990 RepID=UPI0037FDC45D